MYLIYSAGAAHLRIEVAVGEGDEGGGDHALGGGLNFTHRDVCCDSKQTKRADDSV
jgi:hypothetical protein